MPKYINLVCDQCKKPFTRSIGNFNYKKKQGFKTHFCSRACQWQAQVKKVPLNCSNCGKGIDIHRPEKKRQSNRYFCGSSCAAIYNNTHKTKGTRISKLERYLQTELPILFPSLEFVFNGKEVINSELDIYIPTLKLAIELNGIFHYEPIYGPEKLGRIKNNDNRKSQACHERGIEFCVIDISALSYFKLANAKPYLDIVVNLINTVLASKTK